VLTEASPPGKHDHFDIELVSPHVTPVHCCDGPRARLDGLSLGRSARHSVDYDCALLGRESQPRRTPEPSRYENWRNMRARCTIRYNDPRRFGTLLWLEPPTGHHPLLASLGPEPLSGTFDGDYLYARSRGRKLAVKSFVMDGRVVVGVGNIYASEALYMAGIHPLRAAGRVSLARYRGLAESISDVLQRAIRQGGTTLRDFSGAGGLPGYFAQDLLVYARAGQPCFQCAGEIRQKVIGQRASYYCAVCQR
jgi:formamidopyrimidine-DNA glycosylase